MMRRMKREIQELRRQLKGNICGSNANPEIEELSRRNEELIQALEATRRRKVIVFFFRIHNFRIIFSYNKPSIISLFFLKENLERFFIAGGQNSSTHDSTSGKSKSKSKNKRKRHTFIPAEIENLRKIAEEFKNDEILDNIEDEANTSANEETKDTPMDILPVFSKSRRRAIKNRRYVPN